MLTQLPMTFPLAVALCMIMQIITALALYFRIETKRNKGVDHEGIDHATPVVVDVDVTHEPHLPILQAVAHLPHPPPLRHIRERISLGELRHYLYDLPARHEEAVANGQPGEAAEVIRAARAHLLRSTDP